MGMVKVKSVKMHINAFWSDEEIELKFPDAWDITEHVSEGSGLNI